VQVGTTPLLECAGCDGVWMDSEPFERLCADRDARASVLGRYAGRTPVAETAIRYRPCPRCRKMMNRVNFGRVSGTVVDVCKGHGVFLDAGELRRIVSFIQEGGLERAREERLEEIREEERRLKDLEWKIAHQTGHAAAHHEGTGMNAIVVSDLIRLLRG